jgi:hypothetical protein
MPLDINPADLSDRILTRSEASEKLTEWFGQCGRIGPATLAKYACLGGGPPMLKFARRVGYPERQLYKWGRARARFVASTSDAGEAA